jgi:two-component system LytT family response regulator
MKIFIVEDEKESLDYLKNLITSSVKDDLELNVASSVKDAVEKINETRPDLVFMDINLPDGTGFDVLEKVDYKDFLLIFVTAFDDFALKAFKVNAIDYLLKPVNIDDFNNAMQKVKSVYSSTNEAKKITNLLNYIKSPEKIDQILVNTSDNLYVLKLSDILYLKSESNYTKFYVENVNDEIIVSKTLKEYEEILKDHNFVRTHNSYLVNLNWISKIIKKENVVELKNGVKVPISARRKEAVVKELNRFIKG